MKKVFKICVVALLTVVAMSCAQNVGGDTGIDDKDSPAVGTDSRYVLWDNVEGEGKTTGYGIFSDKITGNEEIAASTNYYLDHAVNSNGDIYVLEKVKNDSNRIRSAYEYFSIVKYDYKTNNKTVIKENIINNNSDNLHLGCAIDVVYDPVKDDNLILYLNSEYDNEGKVNDIYYFYEKEPAVVNSFVLGSKSIISNFVVNVNDLYFAEFTPPAGSKETLKGWNVKVIKNFAEKIDQANISTALDIELVLGPIPEIDNCSTISDMAISESTLYCLFFNIEGSSYGGILSVGLNGTKESTVQYLYKPESPSEPDNMETEVQTKFFLVGPRKFLAIKPKKLVLNDDGCYGKKDGDTWQYKNINRIVTVDLEKSTFSSADMKNIEFDGFAKIEKTGGSGYDTLGYNSLSLVSFN